jgi:diadenosine tetraphosphatase ApaH/serine/threonine PP2A family protein phosphatase
MRYLVLGDVHANIDALEAVLDAAAGSAYERVLVLGDLVGYGAEPNAVVQRIRALGAVSAVRGNHDKVAAGVADTEDFNPLARQAAAWTVNAISDENRAFLAALPLGPIAVDDLIEICHGSPFDEDAYVVDSLDAIRAINDASRPVCVYGHTHIPMAMALVRGEFKYEDTGADDTVSLESGARYMINAGSVGQPRDGDPRAAWAIIDTARMEVGFRRTPYDVATAQARIRNAGLPDSLARRLAAGR